MPDNLYYDKIIIKKRLFEGNKYIGKNYQDIEKMQINIEENKKEIKEHGSFSFPVHVCTEKIEAYEQGSFLWHWHPEVELTLILSGKIDYHVNDKSYILTEGEALFGNANTLHSGYRKDGADCTYLSITFHPRFLYGYENSILHTKYVEPVITCEKMASLAMRKEEPWQPQVIEHMEKIYEMSLNPPEDYEYRVHLLLSEIWFQLYHYFEKLPEKEDRSSKHLERLRQMISYLQEHYRQEINLSDVAKEVNICKSECCRFFKKHMNMTIFEYIFYYRIQESLPLLRAGESVTNVSGMVGFSSPAYFGQIFKRYMKCTPRAYRSQYQEGKKEALALSEKE